MATYAQNRILAMIKWQLEYWFTLQIAWYVRLIDGRRYDNQNEDGIPEYKMESKKQQNATKR